MKTLKVQEHLNYKNLFVMAYAEKKENTGECMKERLKKENILTIPNLLSLLRIVLIPVIVWLYCVKKDVTATIVMIAVSGLTDIIDGRIARKFNMISDVGKVLDPVADKLTQMAMIFCLISTYPKLWALVVLFVVKESIMFYWGYRVLKSKDEVNSAKWYGKLSTVVLYGVMAILIFFTGIPEMAANVLILFCGVVMAMSLIMYGRFYKTVL